jgi:hypothetical protein
MKRKTGFTTHAQGPSESGVEIWLWLVLGVGPAELRCTCLRQQAEANPNQHANGRPATPLPLLPRVPAASRGRSKEVLLPVVWYKGRSRLWTVPYPRTMREFHTYSSYCVSCYIQCYCAPAMRAPQAACAMHRLSAPGRPCRLRRPTPSVARSQSYAQTHVLVARPVSAREQ